MLKSKTKYRNVLDIHYHNDMLVLGKRLDWETDTLSQLHFCIKSGTINFSLLCEEQKHGLYPLIFNHMQSFGLVTPI